MCWITRPSVFSSSSSSNSRPTNGAATDRRPAVAVEDLDQAPGELRLGEALQVDRADLLGLDDAGRQPSGEGPDDDLAGRGGLLEPGGDVDRLAGGEGRVRLVGDDLARLDADPRLEPELVHRVENRGGGADRALGVVLVRLRDPEGGHDGVARELLDDAAVRRDAVRDVLEERVDAPPDDFRVACGDELGRADEIDEDNRCELPFHSVIVVTRGRVTAVAGLACAGALASARALSGSLQGLRRPRALPGRARRGGRVRDRPRVRRAVRAEADRRRPGHAPLLALDGGGADRRRRRRRRRRARPRDGRDGDGLLRRRRARARRRRLRHRLPQPEAVHRHEDRARRRAAGRRRVGSAGRARPRAEAVRAARDARSCGAEERLGRLRRPRCSPSSTCPS